METNKKTKKSSLSKLLSKGSYQNYSFIKEFNRIIEEQIDGYSGKTKDKLKYFLEDMQKGGCMSGMIGEFIYHSDCKDFYIKYIDCLEEFKNELEESIGEAVQNRHSLPHYTFVVWLCFEEYCYNLYNNIFEQ
jgi:hypothetical protein